MAKYMCPQCYTAVIEDGRFCMNCGADLEMVGRVRIDEVPDVTTSPVEPDTKEGPGFRVTMLSMTTNEREVREIKTGAIVVGRESGDWIIDDPSLSPRHAMLTVNGSTLKVNDLNSLNGVYQKVLEPTLLKGGEYLLIGTSYMRFEVVTAPDDFAVRMYVGPKDDYPVATLTIILSGCRDGEVHPVNRLPFSLGRESGDLILSGDRFLSHRHCRLISLGSGIGIEDSGSTNGTFIKIREKSLLQHGDWLYMGRYLFKVESL